MTSLSSNLPTGNAPGAIGSVVPSGSQAGTATVVTLTPEQSSAAMLELRDNGNQLIGYLVKGHEVTLYFTPQEMDALRQRAAAPVPGKTMREIREIARQRVEG